MPTYTVRGPSGASYTIDGPEGATADQLGAAILANVPAERQRQALHQQIAARVDADPVSTGALNFAKDMPTWQTTVAGYGKAGSDLVRGIGQKLGIVGQDSIDEQKRLDNPLMSTTSGKAGNLIGAIADTAPTMLVPGANSLGGAAATGAVLGALQPTATGESTLKNAALGGAFGLAGAGVAKAAGAGWRAAKAIAEPFTKNGPEQIAGRTLERFATDPSSIARASSNPTVTGALPTLAEQTGDVGIARLQDALGAADPQLGGALQTRASLNNAARVGKLRDMAGEDGGRDFAAANRAGTAGPMYDEAFQVVPDTSLLTAEQSRSLQTLMKSPAVQAAMKDARAIAANNGKNVGPANASGSIEGMHNMKLSMDDAISAARAAGQPNKAASIQSAQKQLIDLMESMSPEYRNARSVYADMSAPINQMDIAGALLKRGAAATTDPVTGAPRLMPDAFLRTLGNPGNLIKQATGRDLGGNLDTVMTPEQRNMIGAIAKEVDASAGAMRSGNGPGSATAQRIAARDIMREILSPSVAPAGAAPGLVQQGANAIGKTAMTYTGLGALGKAANWAYSGIASPRIQQALAQTVLSPGDAQKALDAAVKANVKLPETLLKRLTLQAAQQGPGAAERSLSETSK